MENLTTTEKVKAVITALVIAALLLFGCYCAFGAMRWALCDAIDCEIDAHSRAAFGDAYDIK